MQNVVLVTGGTGFVGRYVLERIAAHHERVYVTSRRPDNILPRGEKITYIRADLTGGKYLSVLPRVKTVYHLAGTTPVGTHARNHFELNYTATRNLFQWARQTSVSRFVYLSSAAVVAGTTRPTVLSENTDYPIDMPGVYAASKAAAEKYLLEQAATGPHVAILRAPFVWGRGDQNILPRLIDAVKSKSFSWINKGNYPYAVCHVRNLAYAISLCGLYTQGNQIFYPQDHELTTQREFLSALLVACGLEPPTRSTPRTLILCICRILELLASAMRRRSEIAAHLREITLLMGYPLTISACRNLEAIGYRPVVDRQTGLAEIKTAIGGK